MCGFILGLRGMVVIRGNRLVDGKNRSHFVSRPSLFSRPPSKSGDVIFSNARPSLSFTLHGVQSNLKTRIRSSRRKSSLKRAGELFCISKVLLLEFVLREYYNPRFAH